jgi:preprotein translocase subunit SecG
MSVLLNVVLAIQMLAAIVMIGLVLLQQGKGADMGAAFGSGSSGSLFGASGSANFMSRTTGILAAVFFASTLTLAYFGNLKPAATGSVLEGALPATSTPASASAPVVPASAATGAAQIPTK